MTVTEAITKRSSTRGYSEEKLTDEEIKKVIEAGLKAPTATNRQELHFSVLKGDAPILKELEADKNALKGIDKTTHNFYYEAPVVIFISAEIGFRWSVLDAGIAVENMALAAVEMGLSNLIIGCVYDALRGEKKDYYAKALGIPEGYEFEIALAIGHGNVTKAPHTYDESKLVSFE